MNQNRRFKGRGRSFPIPPIDGGNGRRAHIRSIPSDLSHHINNKQNDHRRMTDSLPSDRSQFTDSPVRRSRGGGRSRSARGLPPALLRIARPPRVLSLARPFGARFGRAPAPLTGAKSVRPPRVRLFTLRQGSAVAVERPSLAGCPALRSPPKGWSAQSLSLRKASATRASPEGGAPPPSARQVAPRDPRNRRNRFRGLAPLPILAPP